MSNTGRWRGGQGEGSLSERVLQVLDSGRLRSFEEIAAECGCCPYAVARIAEQSVGFPVGLLGPAMVHLRSTPTERLLERLADMGIDLTEAEFVAAARGRRSAWELSRQWRVSIPADRPQDHDFAALAVCELWRRWCPDQPSMEMVDDLMQEGYACLLGDRWVNVYDPWWSAWRVLRDWITPEMRTLRAADAAFQGSELFSTWIQSFASPWTVGEPDVRVKRERNLALLRECMEQFPDEDPELLRQFRVDLAVVHFALGERSEGRAVLEAMIVAEPTLCAPYSALAADLYHKATTPEELEEAMEILLRAKAADVVDGDIHDLDLRIVDACESLSAMLWRGKANRPNEPAYD